MELFKNRSTRAAALTGLALALSGCGGDVNKFKKLSEAGVELTNVLPELYEKTADQGAEVRALVLENQRPQFDRNARRAIILDAIQNLEAYRFEIDALKAHSANLGRLFAVMGQLAGSDVPDRMGAEASKLISTLDGISGAALSSAAGVDVSELAGVAGKIVIRAKISSDLKQFLNNHGDSVVRNLELHERAQIALADKFESDAKSMNANVQNFSVRVPYIGKGTLPKNWRSTLVKSVRPPAILPAFRGASKSMGEAKKALKSLLSGDDTVNFDLFLQNVSAVLDFLNKAEGA